MNRDLRNTKQEVQDSNLDPDAGYPDWSFSWFSSIPPGKCLDGTLILAEIWNKDLPNTKQEC
jgi:hypothetical protein